MVERISRDGRLGQVDATVVPRFAGPPTFARLPRLADVGDALLQARAAGGDVNEAVGDVVPWQRLPAVLAEAPRAPSRHCARF